MPKNENENEKQPKVLLPGLSGQEEGGENGGYAPQLQKEIVHAVKATPTENLEALIEGKAEEGEADDKYLAAEINQEQPVSEKTGEERRARPAEERRPAMRSGEELLMHGLPDRCARLGERLRSYLTGTILIKLNEMPRPFLFDWRDQKPDVRQVDPGTAADCSLQLGERTLLRAAAGDFNPQIGMLSDKIKVSGRFDLAMYFFNLLSGGEGHD